MALYVLRPRSGVFSGTRVLFNFGDAVREPKLTDEFGSLYKFLSTQRRPIVDRSVSHSPLSAPTTRTYEGGVAQSFLSDHILFSRKLLSQRVWQVELESVGSAAGSGAAAQSEPSSSRLDLEQFLTANFAFSLTLNSQAYRAQGAEAALEGGIGRRHLPSRRVHLSRCRGAAFVLPAITLPCSVGMRRATTGSPSGLIRR